MNTLFDAELLANSIKGQLETRTREPRKFDGPSPWTKRLKMHEGHYYIVRLLPYVKNDGKEMDKTIFCSKQFTFSDAETHKRTYVQSPATFKQPCPFMKYRDAFLNRKPSKEEYREFDKKLQLRDNRYINALLIDTDDEEIEKDKNGKAREGAKSPKERIGEVVFIQIPNSLWKVMNDGLNGKFNDDITAEIREFSPDAPEVNLRVDAFNLSKDGINLQINVTHNDAMGGYADYATSKFTFKKRDLKRSEEQIKAILEDCVDLTKLNKKYTFEECETILRKGFLGLNEDGSKINADVNETVFGSAAPDAPKADAVEESSNVSSSTSDMDMDEFLAGLPDDI